MTSWMIEPHFLDSDAYPSMPKRPFNSVAWVGTDLTEEQWIRNRSGMQHSVKAIIRKGMTPSEVVKLLGTPDEVRDLDSNYRADGSFKFCYTIGRMDDGLGPLFHEYSWREFLFVSFGTDGRVDGIGEGPSD